jgi:ubiquinone/menaquinone biosynthesis C-methylase UbiE
MMSRAIQSELLEQRIVENAAAQEIDLATWIFEKVRVRPGNQVLELCCGTGGQTLPLLKHVGEEGHVVALDISKAALEALTAKTDSVHRARLTCVEGTLEDFSSAIRRSRTQQDGFDLIFCAYGLYYSTNAAQTLQNARALLKPGGSIAVVGPFGPNNKQLFDLVRASGAAIAEPVTFSSELFMSQTVLPWAARNFDLTTVHSMVNPVRWNTPERVLNYWQNTTFYDAGCRPAFERLLEEHFATNPVFVNEKWVMLMQMSQVRA